MVSGKILGRAHLFRSAKFHGYALPPIGESACRFWFWRYLCFFPSTSGVLIGTTPDAQRIIKKPHMHSPLLSLLLLQPRPLATPTKQERIEEEKYIRQKEHEDYLKRRAEQVDEEAAKARDEAQKAHDDAMHDTIDELFGVLAKTGDKISDIGVENLALWKLGKK